MATYAEEVAAVKDEYVLDGRSESAWRQMAYDSTRLLWRLGFDSGNGAYVRRIVDRYAERRV